MNIVKVRADRTISSMGADAYQRGIALVFTRDPRIVSLKDAMRLPIPRYIPAILVMLVPGTPDEEVLDIAKANDCRNVIEFTFENLPQEEQ